MRTDKKILKYLYKTRNDGNFHILVEEKDMAYDEIIGPIEDLAANGLIIRAVEQTLRMFEDPDPDFDHRKVNTKCKISQAGIMYFEKIKETYYNKRLSITAIIISIATLAFTILDRFILND